MKKLRSRVAATNKKSRASVKKPSRFLFNYERIKNAAKTSMQVLTAVAFCVFVVVIACYFHIETYKVYEDIGKVPTTDTALLLGTSKYVAKGVKNDYYTARIDAAIALYKKGKVKRIIASGDFSTRYYNEPLTMRKDLIDGGVNPKDIIIDNAGLRTLDSVRRCRDIFFVSNPLIISQKFHCRRALYLADSIGMHAASGFAAKDDSGVKSWLKKTFREMFARTKAVMDASGVTN